MQNSIRLEGLTFRAELSKCDTEWLELAKVYGEEARRGPLRLSPESAPPPMEGIPENLEALLRSLASDALKEDKNSKRVQHSSGQIMRLLLDAKRTEQGYRGADVFVGPSRTEEAYVAAVLALHGEEMERERDEKNRQSDEMAQASKAILFFELMRSGRTDRAARETVYQAMKDLHLYKESPSRATDFVEGLRLTPVYELLRYFRPELDDMSEKERIALLERTIYYINEYLKALRRLTAFLQYGKTGAYEGLPNKKVTQAGKQVRAAEFRELVKTEQGDPLPYSEIGKLLGEKPAPGQMQPHLIRGYDARISRMAKDGRGILKQALGEEGYRAYMEEKRAELEHWQTLSKDEQNAIHMEETFGISARDAYEIVDEQDYRDYMKAKRNESPEKS
jgi:hypothetical protein